MSNDKLAATFSGGEEEPAAPGMEIDVRPHPALAASDGGSTRNLSEVAARIRSAREAAEAEWPEGHVTGAFVSAAASIRHEVRPYRWWEAAGSMLLLYLAVIGIPLGLIAFAVYEIMRSGRG